jgi:hypothetical protein
VTHTKSTTFVNNHENRHLYIQRISISVVSVATRHILKTIHNAAFKVKKMRKAKSAAVIKTNETLLKYSNTKM